MSGEPVERLSLALADWSATERLAQSVAEALQGGEVIALQGDLGAGKTSFVRALTRALGCSRLATSPTFSLFARYRGGRLPVLHGDLYRLNTPEELEDLGWWEMLEQTASGVVLVEWADRFPELLPPDRLVMQWCLDGAEEERRQLALEAHGARSHHLLRALEPGGQV